MKTSTLLSIFAAAIFAFASCSGDKNQQASETNSDVALETRGVQGTKGFGNKFMSEDNTYIVLKLDGTFEASFQADDVVIGNWAKENDGKTLKLTGSKSNEGKGQTYSKEFTVLEHNDDIISLVDSEGKKIEMKSE
jgi:hypothetical protein